MALVAYDSGQALWVAPEMTHQFLSTRGPQGARGEIAVGVGQTILQWHLSLTAPALQVRIKAILPRLPQQDWPW